MSMDRDDPRSSGLRRTYPDRRKFPRLATQIPASVQVTTQGGSSLFDVREAMIADISQGGIGLALTITTSATPKEMSKMFLQRLLCQVSCHFPGTASVSCLEGPIAWVTPEKTTEGMGLRFGVNLEGCDPVQLEALMTYLESMKAGGPKASVDPTGRKNGDR